MLSGILSVACKIVTDISAWLLQDRQTGLMLAAKGGHEEVVKFLLSKGVNCLRRIM